MRLALTFDAEHLGWPNPPDTCDRILDALGAFEVRATFFIQGRWAQAYPHLARRIAGQGHLIGNHTHHHAPLARFHDGGVWLEVLDAEHAIERITGVSPKPWLRCPFGSGGSDHRVLSIIAEMGYRQVGWDIDSGDWNQDGPDDILPHLLAAAHEGGVVLFHTWSPRAAAALPELLDSGHDFVTVDEL